MRKASVGLGFAALCVAILVAWAIPRPLGDLYLALAGGNDVLAGKLGKPDDWSYTAEGRVWVNSSWGSDVVFALIHQAAGDAGLLAMKALCLAALGLLVARVARVGGATWTASLIAAALAVAASPQDLILRPNLISLLFVPLLLLLLGRPDKGKGWIVAIGGLFLLWTNVHGAFVFGLLVLALWAVTSPTRPRWIGVAAFGAALGVALFANPFGPKNLWLQLVVPRSAVWRNVIEWGPLWGPRPPGVAFPVLFVVLALVAVVGQLRFLRRQGGERRSNRFELSLVVVGILLPLMARRLVPWTAVAMATAAARTLDDLAPERRRPVLLTVTSTALIVFLVAANRWVPSHYARNHPLFPNESVFDRMVFHGTHFPVGAAEFLAANHVEANAFNEWRWEGYLREYAPGVKVMIGGRAHQIYDEATYMDYRRMLAGRSSVRDHGGFGLAIVPLTPEFGNFCRTLLHESWSYIYADRYSAVFASPKDPSTRDLVLRASAGGLTYPDSASSALSRALCLSSPATADPVQALALLQRALILRPTSYAYPLLVRTAIKTEVPRETLIAYLEQEDGRLERASHNAPEENALLECRLNILQELGQLYPTEANDKKQRLLSERAAIDRRMQAIANAYPAYFR
jgi:hypothetical protein